MSCNDLSWRKRPGPVANILVDPEGSLEKRNHWEKTSHALLVGAILHVLYVEEDKTLAGVAAFLSDPKRPIESTLAAMMTAAHLGEAGPHPVIASAARELDRRMTRMERDLGISVEMLAVFVRFWLTTTPALPEPAAQAARAEASKRYEAFVTALGQRLAKGPKLRQEISEDVCDTQKGSANG